MPFIIVHFSSSFLGTEKKFSQILWVCKLVTLSLFCFYLVFVFLMSLQKGFSKIMIKISLTVMYNTYIYIFIVYIYRK